jgi:hypothetical protein
LFCCCKGNKKNFTPYQQALTGKKIDNQHVEGIESVEEIFPKLRLEKTSFPIVHIDYHKRKKHHRLHWQQRWRYNTLDDFLITKAIHQENKEKTCCAVICL